MFKMKVVMFFEVILYELSLLTLFFCLYEKVMKKIN